VLRDRGITAFLGVNGRPAPKPIIASFIAVAETEAEARSMFENAANPSGTPALPAVMDAHALPQISREPLRAWELKGKCGWKQLPRSIG
jgi:hypothetical protein